MNKSTALLTVALFFTIAPSPDAEVWSEITGGFLKASTGIELATIEFDPALQIAYVSQKPSFKMASGF